MSDFLNAVLPKDIVAPTLTAPRTVLCYSDYKAGKTTIASIVSQSYKALLLDYEDGSEAQASWRINVPKKVRELNARIQNPLQHWSRVKFVQTLAAELEKASPRPYDFIFHDKVDTLEDWCEKWATAEYKQSVIGGSFTGNSVLELPDGGGYRYLRDKFDIMWSALAVAAPHNIFFCSQRVNRNAGAEADFVTKDLDLCGKVRKITAGSSDAPCHLTVREDGSRWISFRTPDKGAFAGNRFAYLEGQEIKLSWKDETGKVVVDWEKLFPGAKRRENGTV